MPMERQVPVNQIFPSPSVSEDDSTSKMEIIKIRRAR